MSDDLAVAASYEPNGDSGTFTFELPAAVVIITFVRNEEGGNNAALLVQNLPDLFKHALTSMSAEQGLTDFE